MRKSKNLSNINKSINLFIRCSHYSARLAKLSTVKLRTIYNRFIHTTRQPGTSHLS